MLFKNKDVIQFNVKALVSKHYVGNYIPVTMLVHALAWSVFGNADWGHHLLNILLHVLNAMLVFQLGRRLFRSELISLTGCLVFLLHPLQIESVGWISELKNVLSTTFYLFGLLYYHRYKEQPSQKNYLLTFLWFVLAGLSKSSAVVFPLTLICLDLIIDKKWRLVILWNKLPMLLVSLVLGIINIRTQAADLFINHAHEFPFYQRFGFAGIALLSYARLVALPINLSVIYSYPEGTWAVFALGFAALVLVATLVILAWRRRNFTLLGLVLFSLVNLLLVLQFLPFGEVLYADRYAYVPLIGAAWGLGFLIEKIKVNPLMIQVVLLLYFTAFTAARIGVWKSAMSLYEDIIRKYPDQFVALNSAGVESMLQNDDQKALDLLNRAVKAAPRNYKGYYNRGLVYLKNKQAKEAIASFNEALAIYPYVKAYTGRAAAYYLLSDIPKAMNDANFVLQTEPNNANARFVLANCLNDLNKLEEAMAEYNRCIALKPDEADYYFKRAIVFGKRQDFKACLNDLDLSIYLRADNYEAYYWRGVAKVNLRQNPCSDLVVAARHNYEPAIKAYNTYCKE